MTQEEISKNLFTNTLLGYAIVKISTSCHHHVFMQIFINSKMVGIIMRVLLWQAQKQMEKNEKIVRNHLHCTEMCTGYCMLGEWQKFVTTVTAALHFICAITG